MTDDRPLPAEVWNDLYRRTISAILAGEQQNPVGGVSACADRVLFEVITPELAVRDAEIDDWKRRAADLDDLLSADRAGVAELTRERDQLLANLSGELSWLKSAKNPDRAEVARAVGFEDAVRTVRQAFESGRPVAQEAGEQPECPHSADRIENDEVTADEHERLCLPRRPRVWQKGDPEPADRPAVRDCQGDTWRYTGAGPAGAQMWVSAETAHFPWEYVAKKWAPLTEVIEGDSEPEVPAWERALLERTQKAHQVSMTDGVMGWDCARCGQDLRINRGECPGEIANGGDGR